MAASTEQVYATIVVFDDSEPKASFLTYSEEETVQRILAIAFDGFTQRLKTQNTLKEYGWGNSIPNISPDLKLSDVKNMSAMELVNFINHYQDQSYYFFMGSINGCLINFSFRSETNKMII
jgi:hypothetical protein